MHIPADLDDLGFKHQYQYASENIVFKYYAACN